MPQRDTTNVKLDPALIRKEPGYDWVDGRFGPPPGIPRPEKQRLDGLSDRDYLRAVLKKTPDEIESLMVSEAERRRTFRAVWPIEDLVPGIMLAKEGFYYLGSADRVKCAFCAGIIKNWDKGDNPRMQHHNYFGFCKFVQGRANENIPFDELGMGDFLITAAQPGATADHLSATMASGYDHGSGTPNSLNIITTKPKVPEYSIHANRVKTFKDSPFDTNKSEIMADAGLFFVGPGDKVKCFFCSGTLEGWEEGDDPWTEHGKWYCRCAFVIQCKGGDFIRKSREEMSEEDKKLSEELMYNASNVDLDVNPTSDKKEPKPKACDIKEYQYYKFAHEELGHKHEALAKVYRANEFEEFPDLPKLIGILLDIEEDNHKSLDSFISERRKQKQHEPMETTMLAHTEPEETPMDITDIITSTTDLTEGQSKALIKRVTCKVCKLKMSGAVVLPCGCFALCHNCCERAKLPPKCPSCGGKVKGACKTFLS